MIFRIEKAKYLAGCPALAATFLLAVSVVFHQEFMTFP
jgi:hypothetical protein